MRPALFKASNTTVRRGDFGRRVTRKDRRGDYDFAAGDLDRPYRSRPKGTLGTQRGPKITAGVAVEPEDLNRPSTSGA